MRPRRILRDSSFRCRQSTQERMRGFSLQPASCLRHWSGVSTSLFNPETIADSSFPGFPLSFGVFQDYYSTHEPFKGSSKISIIGTCASVRIPITPSLQCETLTYYFPGYPISYNPNRHGFLSSLSSLRSLRTRLWSHLPSWRPDWQLLCNDDSAAHRLAGRIVRHWRLHGTMSVCHVHG